jgi:hypothetical protein
MSAPSSIITESRLGGEGDDLPARRGDGRRTVAVVQPEPRPPRDPIEAVHDDLHTGLLLVEAVVLRRADGVCIALALLLLALGEQLVHHLAHDPIGLLAEVLARRGSVGRPIVVLRIDTGLRAGVHRHHRHRIQALEVEHAHHLADPADGVEHRTTLEVLSLLPALRGEDELAVGLVQHEHVDRITGGGRIFELAPHERGHLPPEGDDLLLAVERDTQLHITEVVLEEPAGILLPEVTDCATVALLADAEFDLPDRIKPVGIQLRQLCPFVRIQQIEDHPSLHIRTTPPRAPHLTDP